MSINVRCPRCGGDHVQLSSERSKHGCLWFILFGIYYIAWILVKWTVGISVLILWDWWMAIVCALLGRGYVWKSRGWFSTTKRIYYCHDCGHNFRG
ncbi:MAG: hypothetical protein ACI4S4_01475 [Candidatus Ornithospirochaeta sp.]